jgi:epoxyqueuosine reductase
MADALRQSEPEHDFRCAVDTAPLLEREHAHRAGIGWVGKHTLLIHPQRGSWMLLGGIVTTLAIEHDDARPMPDHCGTCTRCIDACPTDCITPYAVDASRCVGYLTIEHRGAIDATLHEAMGDWIAGCDICQEVCPYNSEGTEHHAAYAMRPPGPAAQLLDVLGWDAPRRQDALVRSALKRIKLDMWKRNALIAAGNYLLEHDHAELRGRIKQIATDENEPPMVRQTAVQTLQRIGGDV